MVADGHKLPVTVGVLGVAGLVAAAFGSFVEPRHFSVAWLASWIFWLGITLGSLAMAMLHRITGGAWGDTLEPVFTAASRTMPLLLVLAIPLFFEIPYLYSWSRPDQLPSSPQIERKLDLYLNRPEFVGRLFGYLVVWQLLSSLFNRQTANTDNDPSGKLAAAGLITYALTATLAATDLIISVQPLWYSTIFGMVVIVSETFVATAFATASVNILPRLHNVGALVLPPAERNCDFGNLLLMFSLVGIYLAFSQYLIIWYGNLPHEIAWYIPRQRNGWQWVALFLIAFHFAIPTFVLLFREAKESSLVLAWLAGSLIPVHLIYVYWLIAPNFRNWFSAGWIDIATVFGMGGVWLSLFIYRLQSGPWRVRAFNVEAGDNGR